MFCIPFANSINTAPRKEKHVFLILVLDDHVLRKRGSRVYVVVVTVILAYRQLTEVE